MLSSAGGLGWDGAVPAFQGDWPVKDVRLDGKVDYLVPLVLDSVYHALR